MPVFGCVQYFLIQADGLAKNVFIADVIKMCNTFVQNKNIVKVHTLESRLTNKHHLLV